MAAVGDKKVMFADHRLQITDSEIKDQKISWGGPRWGERTNARARQGRAGQGTSVPTVARAFFSAARAHCLVWPPPHYLSVS